MKKADGAEAVDADTAAAATPEAEHAQHLEKLWAQVSENARSGLHDRVAKVASELLDAAPGDETAMQCKAVALLQVQDFEGALAALEVRNAHDLHVKN